MSVSHSIITTLEQLEEKSEKLAFDIAGGKDKTALHKQTMELIVGIAEIKKQLVSQPAAINNDEELNEVNKVARRLKRWANNQTQINAKILNEYLKLKRDGVKHITEGVLRTNVGDDATFFKNYPQMKIISPKNHGKVFHIVDDGRREDIVIWEPVRSSVDEYAKVVGIV